MQDFEVIEIDGRKIVIRGIGKSFYQDGFPIAMAVSMFLAKGFSVSLFHLADELLKNAQRLMIFDDLFGDVQKAKHWLLSKTEN